MSTLTRAMTVLLLGTAAIVYGHASKAEDDRADMEEVVVVSSRIERLASDYSNPVFALDAAYLAQSGAPDLATMLKDVPALVGSGSHELTTGDNFAIGASGLTGLDLRNLGFLRTLVLVDGRRVVKSPAPGFSATDIDILPMSLVERVEVTTGGASAVYGADAVTGVVNFVMKDRFEGLSLNVGGGRSVDRGMDTLEASVTWGTGFRQQRGHFSFAAGYEKQSLLDNAERDYATGEGYVIFADNPDKAGNDPGVPQELPFSDLRFFDFSLAGAVDIDLDAIPEFNGDGSPWDSGEIPFVGPFYQKGGSGTLLGDLVSDLLPRDERKYVTLMLDYEISPTLTFVSELDFASSDSFSRGSPTFDFILGIFPDNAFQPAPIQSAAAGGPLLVSRDNVDFGFRGELTDRRTVRGMIGLHAGLGQHHDLEMNYTYGESKVDSTYTNNRYNDRYAAALEAVIDPANGDIVCRSELDPTAEPFNLAFQEWNRFTPLPGTWAGSYVPGNGDCVPIDIFGEGAPSAEALAWINVDSLATARAELQSLQVILRGRTDDWLVLPAGAVRYVAGLEWRDEFVLSTPPEENRLGLAFGNKFDGETGKRIVKEAFVEIDVPIAAERTAIDYLAVDAASRYSDYSTGESTTTWKLGVVWRPVGEVTVRGTRASATRVPSLQELFMPFGQTFEDIADPCDITNLVNGSGSRVQNCNELISDLGLDPSTYTDPNNLSISGVNGGNPNLTEESAYTTTLGFTWRPRFLPALRLDVDWYDIRLKDAINLATAQQIADLCVDLPSLDNVFCALIDRDAGSAAISGFTQRFENVSRHETSGVDVVGRYTTQLDGWLAGELAVTVSGNHLQSLSLTPLTGAPVIDEVGQVYKPENQWNLGVGWSTERRQMQIEASWHMHYFDRTFRYDKQTIDNNPDITTPAFVKFKARRTHDVAAGVTLPGGMSVHVGVSNLTDERPDIGSVVYPVNPIGRYVFLSVGYAG